MLWVAAATGCGTRVLGGDPGSTDAGGDPAPPSTGRDAARETEGDVRDGGAAEAADAFDGGSGSCPLPPPPDGTFALLSAGNDNTCGIRTDGTATCWGASFYAPPSFKGTYKDISRLGGVCAVQSTGALDCWGLSPNVGATPAGVYDQVVVAEDALCARAGAQVSCWGHAGWAPTQYQFESVTGGAYYMCGLEAGQHAAVCWEPRVGAETLIVQDGPFTAVDTGRFFACGLRPDGSVSCWSAQHPPAPSPNTDATILGQPPPTGPFRELSTGEFHACALRAGGEVTCWGEDRYGDTAVPDGLLLAHVSAGSYHTCGIRLDGTVTCWGTGATCGAPR
jgi:hypothetical protein